MLLYSTTIKVIKNLLPFLKTNYSKNLWSNFYKLGFAVINAPSLQLENFDAEKRVLLRPSPTTTSRSYSPELLRVK